MLRCLHELLLASSRGVLEVIYLANRVDPTGDKVELSDTLLGELNPPPQEPGPLVLVPERFLVKLLVLKLPEYVVAHGVPFPIVTVHEDDLLEIVPQVFVNERIDLE